MKLFFDILPIFLFFVAYKLYDIYAATAVAIFSSLALLLFTLLRGKKPDVMQTVTFFMILFLGGLTLAFHNELFIKWKPTVVYWILGSVFFLAPFFYKKNLVQLMLKQSISLPDEMWKTLNATWYRFFYTMGALNLIVVYNFSTDIWVNFKLFGTLALTIVFVLLQAMMISKHLPKNGTK